ncbi:COP-II coat subunit [Coccomyxa subellipsoidea C-169]|uniref:Protein transport protein SEC23 n=1 Tax=Coccomyxa subellipsoidea (strain C-169) TaxID=574566 RepID=I0YZF4_COCSC|nr:COP-II coat subunit [Coccomyxa subellipsoidea C-169]EIE23773.1 COP-II coat subunit [Coccomyxa subellipsoidea C-169]|eukprot:XP_005648317.1 COP-II coat subunit [Coccomyxa subellipsoidea C-169]
MADFVALEEQDGLRLSWNIWPNSRIEATKAVIPFASLYTPNKRKADLQVCPYDPVLCKTCGAVLNGYAQVDFNAALWGCPFCHTRNHFPSQYRGISEQQQPAELYQEYNTIEYIQQQAKPVMPPAYVFVVDTSVAEDELRACVASLSQALTTLPEYAQVGLVTFGTHVHVHELGFAECAKSYVFQGSREYTPQQVVEQLGLASKMPARKGGPGQPALPMPSSPGSRFILPISECEFTVNAVLDELQRDVFPTLSEHRPSRCTGTALQVAASLMGAALQPGMCAARLMLFVGGPSTEGAGKVVEKELSEPIRSHEDLAKDRAPHYKKARRFFDGVASQLVQQQHSLDVFACALDQVGLAEMKPVVDMSGGMVVQTDTFLNPVFKESFKRVFVAPGDPGSLNIASNATFEVIPSRGVKIAGLLGPAAAMDKKSSSIADTHVGIGGTNQWRLAGLDASTTLCTFYEITPQSKEAAGQDPHTSQQFYIQFITRYLHADGSHRIRATTFTRRWTDGSNLGELMAGFDQEAAAVVVARLATFKMETEEDFDATRWIDRTLIRLASRFGDYRPNDPASFTLNENMAFYPQFMFNLRRSQFVQVFGNSPDETANCRLSLNKETAQEATVMIQPSLFSYRAAGACAQVLLDVTSIAPDRILLLDSYFYVVVFHGSSIAQWRKDGFHLNPDHAHFKELLEAPKRDASSILQRRFPVPRLVDCDQNGSQARFLLARLNPSSTYQSQQSMSAEVIMTDDVSLSVFTEHLTKLATQS